MTTSAGADSPYESIVGELERVELAARERRLTAETESERIRSETDAAVAAIEAGVPERIAAALAELRAGYLARAAAEVATVEAELASVDVERPVNAAPVVPDPSGAAFESAVGLLVAAVLAESGE